MTGAPWVWDEHLATDEAWERRPLCKQCYLRVAGTIEQHEEECEAAR